jgi:hypothetical protein
LDKGRSEKKLNDRPYFKSGLKKCVDAGKFEFYPTPIKKPSLLFSKRLQKTSVEDWFWCGEMNSAGDPYGRCILINHGVYICLC